MNFLDLQNRVAQETGLDLSTDADMIKAWINGAYQQLSGFYNWPWLFTNFTLQTIPDYTSYLATVSAGGISVTLDSTVPVSLAENYWIKFNSVGSDWYPISTHTINTASLTLANAFLGASNLVSGTCTIRKMFYDLPSTVDRLTDLRQATTKLKIELVDIRTFDKIIPDPANTGTPTYAYFNGMSSIGNWRIGFYPTPSAAINIQGRGYLRVTELSLNTDSPILPVKWHNVLVFLALALYGHDYIDDTRVQTAAERAREIMKEMVRENNPMPGQMWVIQPWDTRTPRGLMGVRLPSNFPWPWGV